MNHLCTRHLENFDFHFPRLDLTLLQFAVLVGPRQRAEDFVRWMSQKVSKLSSVERGHVLYSFRPSNQITLMFRALAKATSSKSRTPRIPASILATPARSIETPSLPNFLESSS